MYRPKRITTKDLIDLHGEDPARAVDDEIMSLVVRWVDRSNRSLWCYTMIALTIERDGFVYRVGPSSEQEYAEYDGPVFVTREDRLEAERVERKREADDRRRRRVIENAPRVAERQRIARLSGGLDSHSLIIDGGRSPVRTTGAWDLDPEDEWPAPSTEWEFADPWLIAMSA